MKVLLVEPWFGGSHRQWAEGYARHSEHDVRLLTLPGDSWRWRMRGAALTLARQVRTVPDVVLASSFLDLAAFLGHARSGLHDVPVVLYMHENQLTYPLPTGLPRDTSPALVNWNSMAAADAVVFNSEYHRREWFAALIPLIRSHPEPRHTGFVEEVRERTTVLPVGVELSWVDPDVPKLNPPLIVWNQRWEHDKDPATAAAVLTALSDTGAGFRVAICGENPRAGEPLALRVLAERLGERVVQFGFAARPEYERLLNAASLVLSTARHEFFGVGVVEAMGAGAVPVLPDRVVYPELLAGTGLEGFRYHSRGHALELLEALVADPAARVEAAGLARAAAARYAWPAVAGHYDLLLLRVRAGA